MTKRTCLFSKLLALTMCLLLLCGSALADTVRGDLTGRFEEPKTLEKDGETYCLLYTSRCV